MGAPSERVSLCTELPARDLPVRVKLMSGVVLMLNERKATATASDGREVEIDATLAGAPVITVQRGGEPPFVALFSLEALVRAALDAEAEHHASAKGGE